MIVADTNVVSELMRGAPDEHVLSWARKQAAGELVVTVVTVEEIERGLGRLPAGRRRRDLERRWVALVEAFSDGILTYDVGAARVTARTLVQRAVAGAPMGLADAQIAGICLSRGCSIATRNVRDFTGIPGLDVIDPFGHDTSASPRRS